MTPRRRTYVKIRCPYCYQYVQAFEPQDGDGTTLRLPRHWNEKERRCEVSLKLVVERDFPGDWQLVNERFVKR